MSSFNNVLDEIDYFRKSFVSIESILFQNTTGINQKAKRRPPSRSAPATDKQIQRKSSSFSRQSIHLNSVPFAKELPSDVPIPNSVVRNSSFDSYQGRDSSSSEQRRLSKDDIKALLKGAVMNQMNKENETPKQSETDVKEQNRTSDNGTKRASKLNVDRKLSLRRSSDFDKRKSILRSVRRTCEEQAPEIRPSLLEEIRKAIQMENSKETDRELVIADEPLEKFKEGSVVAKKSDTIASSNAWLEHITERLSLSSKRVSELSNKIAATRKSSMISVDSDDSMTWSHRMNETDTQSKSKQSMSDRFKNIDSKSSKQGRDRQFGSGSGSKTSRSANGPRDSKSRLRRVGSPSVLSDKSSFTYRSDDYSTFSRGRKTRSADKERRNSYSNIKVGPAMTRQLEQERTSSYTRIKGSRSNLSPTRSNSADKMNKDFSTRSGSRLVRKSKTTLQNSSSERLNKNGTRSRSNCSVGDARFNLERRSFTKRASLTDLIELYYSTPTRRSTLEGLQSYRASISKKYSDSWGSKVVKDSVISMNKAVKTPKTPPKNLDSFEKNDDQDAWYAPGTPTRSLVSLQGNVEDSRNADEVSMNDNNTLINDNISKPIIVKSIMKNVNEDNGDNKKLGEENDEEQKKKSEKGSRRLSLTGAETLVVPSDALQEEEKEKKRRKSSQRKSSLKLSLPKPVRKKSVEKELINDNKKKEVGNESKLNKPKKRGFAEKKGRLNEIDLSLVEIERKTSELAGLNVMKDNDNIPKRVSKETKNVTPKEKSHLDCKLSDEVDSKLLMNVHKKIRNNHNKIETKVHKQEKVENKKHFLSFNNISLLGKNKEDGKTNTVDKHKTNMKNKILSAIHSDRLFKVKGGKLVASNIE